MVKKRDDKASELDERGLVEKVTSRDFKSLDGGDIMDVAGSAANFIPGPIGNAIDAPISAIAGELKAEKEMAAYTKKFGNLDKAATHSRGIKRKLQELKNRWRDRLGEAAVSSGGLIAGTLATGALALSGPVGWVTGLAGGAAGWYGANKLYNKAFPKSDQNALRTLSLIDKAQQAGEEVPQQVIFAELAADLPRRELNNLENELEAKTGTRVLTEAMADPKNDRVIAQLMAKTDTAIRANNPAFLGVAEFTQLINSGQMKAKDLGNVSGYVSNQLAIPGSPLMQLAQAGMGMPQPARMAMNNSQVSGIASAMNQAGVMPSAGMQGAPSGLPNNNKQPPSKA